VFLDVFGDCSSSVDALGKRLCSLPVMSKSGASIYLLESKLVFGYFRKPKVGRLHEHLLAEDLVVISAPLAPSMPLIGAVAKPMLALARDGVVSHLRLFETRLVSLFFDVASFSQVVRSFLC
jgi:hypothetical protein